jgi:hypothetical protein
VADGAAQWVLRDFLDQLDAWIDTDKPPQDLINHVTAWIMSRADDPYRGVRREPSFPNLWYVTVPGSYVDGAVVLCSYFIVETLHEVHCKGFGTVGWPV